MGTVEQDTNRAGAPPTTSSDSSSKRSRTICLWTTRSRDQNSEHTLSPIFMSQIDAILHHTFATFTTHSCARARLRVRFNIVQSDQKSQQGGGCYYFPNILDMNPFFFLSSDGCLLDPVEAWPCAAKTEEAGIVDDFLVPNPCFRFL